MGYKFLRVGSDANSATGGSTYDKLSTPGPIVPPSGGDFVPVQSASADMGYTDRTRNEVRGVRASMKPIPDRALPTFTFTVELYPVIARWAFPRLTGGTATSTGDAGEAIVSKFRPVGFSGVLPSSTITLAREDQIDYLWGCWIEQAELQVAADNSAVLTVSGKALYGQTVQLGSETFTPDTSAYDDPYNGVTLKVASGVGASPTLMDCVASWGFTFNNSLSEDEEVVYCKGRQVYRELVDGRYVYRQWPNKHLVGRQEITGTFGFGGVMPAMEDRRLLATSHTMIAELTGNPLDTTPAADDTVRFTFPSYVITGGGAAELQDEGEQKSSYEWSGHFDPVTGADFEVEFAGAEAVPAG